LAEPLSRADLAAERAEAERFEKLAAEIAKDLTDRIDQLSLIDYPTSFDEVTRDVVETTLRLGVRHHLERLFG
jgi:hypothetical protein